MATDTMQNRTIERFRIIDGRITDRFLERKYTTQETVDLLNKICNEVGAFRRSSVPLISLERIIDGDVQS